MTTERAPVRARLREHPVEWALGAFGDVRPGEATTALLLALNVFFILGAYYIVKVAREPLILLGGGAEVKSYASVGQSILLVFVASAYGWLASRVRRTVLINVVTLFFVANLLVFAALGERGVKVGVPFFLWVGIFNVVTVAQFWSFAADTYIEERGKRLFPVIGIGSSVGAVAGAIAAEPLLRAGSPFTLMLASAALLVVGLGLTHWVHARESAAALAAGKTEPKEPIGGANAFALVLGDRYLLVFALLVYCLNFVTKTGDYVLDRLLLAQAPAAAQGAGVATAVYIGTFKAHYFTWINGLGVGMQMFVVSRVIKHVGLRAALVLIPIASVLGYGSALALPLIGVLFVGRVAESSLDYSLSNTTQQALWLVTARDAKYKAKQVVDTFIKRAGDTTSAAVVWLGAHFAVGPRGILAANVLFSLGWLGAAMLLGREYARRAPPRAAAPPAGDPH